MKMKKFPGIKYKVYHCGFGSYAAQVYYLKTHSESLGLFSSIYKAKQACQDHLDNLQTKELVNA